MAKQGWKRLLSSSSKYISVLKARSGTGRKTFQVPKLEYYRDQYEELYCGDC